MARVGMDRHGCGRLVPAVARHLGLAALLLAGAGAVAPARAQFFWSGPRFSADDAARVAIGRGFNVLSRPARSDDVYVAEVVDRRGHRGRLIISADTGEVLERTFYQSRGYRPDDDPGLPPGPVPPARIPDEGRRTGFFAKLFGDDGDDRRTRVERPERPPVPEDEPRPRTRASRSRATDQAPSQGPLEITRPAPVESRPLAPASAAPVLPPRIATPKPTAPAPVQASLPPPTAAPAQVAPVAQPAATPAPAATPVQPGRSISTNPLAIPGSREQDEKTKPSEAKADAAKVPARPADPPKAKPATVPVAPLE